MTDNIENLSKHRADKAQDSRLWTPEDAVADLLDGIRSGAIKPTAIAIHYFENNEDGGKTHHYQVSNLTFSEHIALLAVAQARTLKEWIK